MTSPICPVFILSERFDNSFECAGMCFRISTNPITPRCASKWIISTLCSASRGPPTAASGISGRIFRSAAATPAACMSPEASPATKTTLRMVPVFSGERRKRSLYLAHDLERHGERNPAVFARHHYRSFAAQRTDETFELERLAFGSVENYAVDNSGHVELSARRDELRQIAFQPVELTGAGGEIER